MGQLTHFCIFCVSIIWLNSINKRDFYINFNGISRVKCPREGKGEGEEEGRGGTLCRLGSIVTIFEIITTFKDYYYFLELLPPPKMVTILTLEGPN